MVYVYAKQKNRDISIGIWTVNWIVVNVRQDIILCNNLDLEQQLKASDGRIKMIVTDGVFSMDGNVAPLTDICKLADKYNALVFVDECHATGFFGETGRYSFYRFVTIWEVDTIDFSIQSHNDCG